MKRQTKIITIVLTSLILIMGLMFGILKYNKSVSPCEKGCTAEQLQEMGIVSVSDEYTNYISNVIHAISSYEKSIHEVDTITKQYQEKGINLNDRDIKTSFDEAVLMTEVNDLKEGNSYIQSYINNNNQIISLTALGITKSANSMIQPNEDMLQAFQVTDIKKMQSALAETTVAQDKGTNDMLEIMPVIMMGLIFNMKPNESMSSATGNINHNLSREQRDKLLLQIKNEFPEGVNNYSHDIYRLMVYYIQMALVSDTFEQLREIGGRKTLDGAPAL